MLNRQSKGLSGPQIKLFFAILLRNKVVFDQFQVKLTVNHFKEEHFKILYRVLLDFEAEHKDLPTESQLFAEVESFLESSYLETADDITEAIDSFLDYAYGEKTFKNYAPTHEKSEKYAFNIGQKILLQYHRIEMQEDLATQDENTMSVFLDTAFKNYNEIALTGYSTNRTLTFGSAWDITDPIEFTTTGIAFLDKYLNGGTVPGEVYGFMAPYGTCKTTVAVMLWCLAAKQAYQETLISDSDKIGLSVLVSYEAPLSPELRHRALMYSAQVHRDSLNLMGKQGINGLSDDVENPLPYENLLFKQQIADQVFLPERQRVDSVIGWLNEHTLCLDFSGADPANPRAGYGGIQEILQRIKLELRNRGNQYYVKNLIIDYLGVMVDRDSSIKTKKDSEDHKLLQATVARIGREIAKPFKCPVWVVHQLSGSANAVLNVSKTLHHTDAKGSKSVAENMDFAFVVSNLNLDSMGKIACTKQRRAKRLPPTVIQVEGEFNLVKSPDNFYLDAKGNIVDKSIMASAGASADGYEDIQALPESNVTPTTGSTVQPNIDTDFTTLGSSGAPET